MDVYDELRAKVEDEKKSDDRVAQNVAIRINGAFAAKRLELMLVISPAVKDILREKLDFMDLEFVDVVPDKCDCIRDTCYNCELTPKTIVTW